MSRAVLGICCFQFGESMASYFSKLHWFAHHLLTAGLPKHPVWRQMLCPPPMPLHSFSQGVADSRARHSVCLFLLCCYILRSSYLIILITFDLAQQFLCPWLSFWNQFIPLWLPFRTHSSHFLWQLGRVNAVENTAIFVPALAHAFPFCLQWNDIFEYICNIIRGRFAACVFLFLLTYCLINASWQKKVGEYIFLSCGGKSWMWAYCTLMCKTWNLPLGLNSRFWSFLRYVQNPEVNIFFSKLLPLNIPPLLRSPELLIGDSYCTST